MTTRNQNTLALTAATILAGVFATTPMIAVFAEGDNSETEAEIKNKQKVT